MTHPPIVLKNKGILCWALGNTAGHRHEQSLVVMGFLTKKLVMGTGDEYSLIKAWSPETVRRELYW